MFWKFDDTKIPKSLLGLLETPPDQAAASLKRIALMAHPVHVMWSSLIPKQTICLIDHGKTLLNFFPVNSWKKEFEREDVGLEKNESWYGATSSKAVPLETVK